MKEEKLRKIINDWITEDVPLAIKMSIKISHINDLIKRLKKET